MSVILTLGFVSDAQILEDLQGQGAETPIVGYSTVNGSAQVTWESQPSLSDMNLIAAYFQQQNSLRQWN